MTPATHRPHPALRPGPARHGRPLTAARPPAARPLAAAPPLTAPPLESLPHPPLGRLDPHAASVRTDADYVGIPFCERCGTDEFVYLESFVPAKHRRDGSVSKLGEVAYFCSGCEDFSAHAVPASWVPPGWYLG